MSKEMLIIALGLWTILLTQLGVPYHPWGVLLFVITGIAIAVTGFLLRGESLSRAPEQGQTSKHTTFVENVAPAAASETHDHQEGNAF
jgi:hypothetical protein